MDKKQIIDLLKSWEQFKKANTWESEAIDVEAHLMDRFADMNQDYRQVLSGFHDLQKASDVLEKAGFWEMVEKINNDIINQPDCDHELREGRYVTGGFEYKCKKCGVLIYL